MDAVQLRLEDAIKNAFRWFRHPAQDGSDNQYALVHDFGDDAPYDDLFTAEELDAYDVRLRQVLDHLIVHGREKIDGALIRFCLIYWTNPVIVIPPEASAQQAYLLPPQTVYFSPFAAPTLHQESVEVRYVAFTLSQTPSGLRYVTKWDTVTRLINNQWLDRVRPGWKKQFDLAVELGYTQTEALSHIFFEIPAQDKLVSLPSAGL